MLNNVVIAAVAAALALGISTAATAEQKPRTFTYSNPLPFSYPTRENQNETELRDPCIIHDGDRYYLTYTVWPFAGPEANRATLPDMGSSPGIAMYSSPDLKNWKFENWLVKSSELPDDCPYKHRFWAPEIHKINGKFYMIFTADNWIAKQYNPSGDWGYHAFVGVADKVTGPYKHITYIKDSACDTTLFDAGNGDVYAVMPFGDLFQQKIDLSHLEEGKITLGERKKILLCDNSDIGQPTPHYNEGPWAAKIGSRYYLFYAETFDNGYWTGVAYADSPQGPWRKDPRGKVFEGGHLAVFAGPDGRNWFSYRGETDGASRAKLAADPFDIARDGTVIVNPPTTGEQTVIIPKKRRR